MLLRIGTSGGSVDAGGNTPRWVFDAVIAEALPDSQKFFTFDNNGTPCTIAVFWDPVYLAKKKAMIAAIGAHYCNNPVVKIVSASFANSQSEDWGVPHTSTDVTNWLAAGYTTEKMLDAGKQIIDTTMLAFPYQYVTLAVGGNGHTGGLLNLDPDESYVARNAVLTARSSWPGRLIVQKNTLSTFTNPAPGTGSLYQLLWDSAPDIGAQMAWYCYGDTTYRVNGGVAIDPSMALTKSVDLGLGYGVNYIEIYRVDILNLAGATKYAHQALTAPAPSPTPTPTPNPTPSPSPTATPTPTPAGPYADLKVTLTNGKTLIVAGQKDTCTIVVTNTGPYNVNGAIITDIFPSAFTGVTFTAIGTGGASGFSATGSGNINDTVNVPVGSFISYKVTATVSSSATGTLTNTASVSPPPEVTDSNLANNSAVDSNAVTTQADLNVSVNDGDSAVFVGQDNTYTITVTNRGPSDAPGAVITDTFPDGFTGVTFSASSVGGASGFTASSTGDIDDTVNLPAGSHITYKAKATVSSVGTGTLCNTAIVVAPSGVPDPNPSDNSASDTDAVSYQADLKVTLNDGTSAAVPGQKLTYTIQVSNTGPTDVSGAVIKNNFPSAFTPLTFTATQTGGASGFSASGTGDINETLTLPAGSHVTYKAKGVISPSASGTLSDTATVTHPSGISDPDLTNNTATDIDQL